MVKDAVNAAKVVAIADAATVIATGGLATLFQEQAHLFDRIEPDLTLNGLMHLYNQRTLQA